MGDETGDRLGVMIEANGDLAAASAHVIRTVPQRFALYLDFDGTLADIAPDPARVMVPPTLIRDLMRLCERFDGAVAILTGRPLVDVDLALAPLKLAGAGVHGAEVRGLQDGPVVQRRAGLSQEVRQRISVAVDRLSEPLIVVEDKGASMAVHVRAVPHLGTTVRDLLQDILSASGEPLRLEHGRRVFEVMPQILSKAEGLLDLSREAPFAGRRPVVIGDDVSDEAAFSAAKAAGGFALPVAGDRFSADDAALRSPHDVRQWLAQLIA